MLAVGIIDDQVLPRKAACYRRPPNRDRAIAPLRVRVKTPPEGCVAIKP